MPTLCLVSGMCKLPRPTIYMSTDVKRMKYFSYLKNKYSNWYFFFQIEANTANARCLPFVISWDKKPRATCLKFDTYSVYAYTINFKSMTNCPLPFAISWTVSIKKNVHNTTRASCRPFVNNNGPIHECDITIWFAPYGAIMPKIEIENSKQRLIWSNNYSTIRHSTLSKFLFQKQTSWWVSGKEIIDLPERSKTEKLITRGTALGHLCTHQRTGCMRRRHPSWNKASFTDEHTSWDDGRRGKRRITETI